MSRILQMENQNRVRPAHSAHRAHFFVWDLKYPQKSKPVDSVDGPRAAISSLGNLRFFLEW